MFACPQLVAVPADPARNVQPQYRRRPLPHHYEWSGRGSGNWPASQPAEDKEVRGEDEVEEGRDAAERPEAPLRVQVTADEVADHHHGDVQYDGDQQEAAQARMGRCSDGSGRTASFVPGPTVAARCRTRTARQCHSSLSGWAATCRIRGWC